MNRYVPLMAALFLTFPALAQQNATPPLYPEPGNSPDTQSQQNVSPRTILPCRFFV